MFSVIEKVTCKSPIVGLLFLTTVYSHSMLKIGKLRQEISLYAGIYSIAANRTQPRLLMSSMCDSEKILGGRRQNFSPVHSNERF